MEEPAAESVVGSGIDTDTKIDTAAPLEVTVRVTFVGQKANQGQLLPLLLPAAASGACTGSTSAAATTATQQSVAAALIAGSDAMAPGGAAPCLCRARRRQVTWPWRAIHTNSSHEPVFVGAAAKVPFQAANAAV